MEKNTCKQIISFNTKQNIDFQTLSLNTKKMLYIVLIQCKKNNKNFYEYEISVKEFAKLIDIATSGVYRDIDTITDEIMNSIIKVKENNQTYKSKYSLFSSCKYENSTFYFKLNPDISRYILELKGGLIKYYLNDFLKMKSTFSIAIWHLMQMYMHSKKPEMTKIIQFDLTLEELRKVTGTETKFKQISEFKNKVFNKAIREIEENCGVKITYENIKKGRSVIGFRCSAISCMYIDENEISQNTKDRAELGKLRIQSNQRELTPEEKKNMKD